MKRVYRVRDNRGAMIEVRVLARNNRVPEDLIWLHFKKKGEESGWTMRPDEARYVIHGLFLAVDYIIEQYHLEDFKLKGRRKL